MINLIIMYELEIFDDKGFFKLVKVYVLQLLKLQKYEGTTTW